MFNTKVKKENYICQKAKLDYANDLLNKKLIDLNKLEKDIKSINNNIVILSYEEINIDTLSDAAIKISRLIGKREEINCTISHLKASIVRLRIYLDEYIQRYGYTDISQM